MLSTSPPLLGSFGGVVSSSECSSDGASHSFGSVRVHAHFGFNVRALPVPPARSMPSNSPFMNCVGKYNGGISHAGQGPLKVVHGFSPVSTLTPPGTSDIGANPSSVDRGTPAYHKSTSSPRNQRASHQTNSVSSEPFSADSFLGDVLTTTERDRRWSAQSLLNAPGVGMDLQASPFPLPCVRDHVSNALASEVDQGPISSEKSTWTHHDFHQWGVKEHAEGMSALVEQKHDAALSPLQGILQSPIHGVVGNSARAGLLKLQLSRNSSEISLSEASIPRKISRSDAPPSPGASCPLLATATEASASAAPVHNHTMVADRYDSLLRLAQDRHEVFQDPVVRRAFDVARSAHTGVFRPSGEPYLAHCVETALELAESGLDPAVVAAGLLHGCLDDSMMTEHELRTRFPVEKEVVDLVVGVSKLRSVSELCQGSVADMNDVALEQLRTLLLAVADVRVLLIKLTDRLQTLRSYKRLPGSRKMQLVEETRQVYIPLANRLGVWNLKCQLEDCCFAVELPDAYRELSTAVAHRVCPSAILAPIAQLEERLSATGLTAMDMVGRHKNLWGVHQKMTTKGKALEQVHDICAFRVVVNTPDECYQVLREVHSLWMPLEGRTKDYIAKPKSNGYQSLHTVVLGSNGAPMEVQIRTQDMHRAAEHGVAAHWRYKEMSPGCSPFQERQVAWARFVLSWKSELNDHKIRVRSASPSSSPESYAGFLSHDSHNSDNCGCTFPTHNHSCKHMTRLEEQATDPVYVLLVDGKTMDVLELPPGATLEQLKMQIAQSRCTRGIQLLVNRRTTSPNTHLVMGDQVEIVLGCSMEQSGSPKPASPPDPHLYMDLSPAAVKRERYRLSSLFNTAEKGSPYKLG